MFDLSRRKHLYQVKVQDLINILENYPNSIITIDGLDEFYIHITEDDNHVGIDVDGLYDIYEDVYNKKGLEFDEDLYDKTDEIYKINKDKFDLSKSECISLLKSVVDNVSGQFLLNHGFTEEQINYIRSK